LQEKEKKKRRRMGRIFSWEYFSFLQLDNAVAYKVKKYIDREFKVQISFNKSYLSVYL
jgi:hypothetical protein